jgi:hypothetical protein
MYQHFCIDVPNFISSVLRPNNKPMTLLTEDAFNQSKNVSLKLVEHSKLLLLFLINLSDES